MFKDRAIADRPMAPSATLVYVSAMTTKTLSLAQRAAKRKESRRRALTALGERLASFAQSAGGRYVLYGSAARGELHATSDVDILVDFPHSARIDALVFAECACAALGLAGDVRTVESASDRLLRRAQTEGLVLA